MKHKIIDTINDKTLFVIYRHFFFVDWEIVEASPLRIMYQDVQQLICKTQKTIFTYLTKTMDSNVSASAS